MTMSSIFVHTIEKGFENIRSAWLLNCAVLKWKRLWRRRRRINKCMRRIFSYCTRFVSLGVFFISSSPKINGAVFNLSGLFVFLQANHAFQDVLMFRTQLSAVTANLPLCKHASRFFSFFFFHHTFWIFTCYCWLELFYLPFEMNFEKRSALAKISPISLVWIERIWRQIYEKRSLLVIVFWFLNAIFKIFSFLFCKLLDTWHILIGSKT